MQILAEDPTYFAVYKPSKLFTQAARGVPSLHEELLAHVAQGDTLPDNPATQPFVGLVHRLDRPTSGIVLFARTRTALRNLNEQFRLRIVAKRYLAIVNGYPAESGIAIDWLRKIDQVAQAQLCHESDDNAKFASLKWRTIAHGAEHSLLWIELQTGRMHQIRLQLSARGWPIVGDSLYGGSDNSELFGLHAAKLQFKHPKTAKAITVMADPPKDWQERFPDFVAKLEQYDTAEI